MTLAEVVFKELDRQQRKHDLRPDYTEWYVNAMTNYELINFMSECLEIAGVCLEAKATGETK